MKEERKQISAPQQEGVRLEPPIGRGTRTFLVFLISCALLVAVFAVSRIWSARKKGPEGQTEPSSAESGKPDEKTGEATGEPDAALPIPEGAIAIRSVDLSGGELRNETAYSVDPGEIRTLFQVQSHAFRPDEPVVLILHTHAQESYRNDGLPYLTGTLGDEIYSTDSNKTVTAVGAAVCQALNRAGVPAVHCTALHGEGGTLRGAYRSAAECIEKYRKQYPSIQYVIDLHRDGIPDADGACVRTASADGKAQILPVVGTDGNGTACPEWRSNLALALLLYDRLNAGSAGSCRAVSLRNSSYNQELAPHSLLLEVGSAGNTVSEAIDAGIRIGTALAELIAPTGNG